MARTTIIIDAFLLMKARQNSGGNLSRFIEGLLQKALSREDESMFGAFSRSSLSAKGLRDKSDRVDKW
jgi:hypothetical protein